jgi:cation/acetate symporter
MSESPLNEVHASYQGSQLLPFRSSLSRIYIIFALSFLCLIGLLAGFEALGMPRERIGYLFLFVTVVLYATIGIVCRTSDPVEYYVAGRRVPALYNGMATAADWMSVASFIGLAGTLYLKGFDGLAFVLGWTGGYVLLALFLAPYLRRFGGYTIPEFLAARYGGEMPRRIGVLCAVVCSFSYLVAQIYGVGLITARLTGISFELGVFIALGSMLVSSFLGGMRAVTWTQVGQYIILLIAYLVPVIWLAAKQTDQPIPHVAASSSLQQITEKENDFGADPAEAVVRQFWQAKALVMQKQIDELPASWNQEREALKARLIQARAQSASMFEIRKIERDLANYPESAHAANADWGRARDAFIVRGAPLKPQAQPFFLPQNEGPKNGLLTTLDVDGESSQLNFIALMFCLMCGTAGLPHILARSMTTPTVSDARKSVFWSLLFILLLYFLAPTLAIFVKNEIYQNVVGLPFSQLPDWVNSWAALDRALVDITDINTDGIVQLGEIHLGNDMVVLAGPEIGGLPFVVSGLVAAGAMAAALSTADGLLLTLSNALSFDLKTKWRAPSVLAHRQVIISKVFLLLVAMSAAWVATRMPADILFMVTAAFSFAAASFFPALVLGIFWARNNRWGVSAGMVAGLVVTLGYMGKTQPWLRDVLFDVPYSEPIRLWWGIAPSAAGVFGLPVAVAVMVIVSLCSPRPDQACQAMVKRLRG